MRQVLSIIVAGLVLSLAGRGFAANASPEELQKQTDFKKAYASSDKEDHLKAVALLDGATHESTRSLLATVIQVDPYKEVQIEAYKILSQMPARDMSLSQLMVSLFNGAKLNDVDTRVGFIGAMKNSEFKYSLIEASAEFANRLRYPELVSNNNGYNNNANRGGLLGNGDPNVAIRKLRAEFEKYLEAFNAFTKAGLKADDKNAPATLRAWVASNRNKLISTDKEALEKYRLEDKEKLDKNNPLLPNKDKKPDEKEGREGREERREGRRQGQEGSRQRRSEQRKENGKEEVEGRVKILFPRPSPRALRRHLVLNIHRAHLCIHIVVDAFCQHHRKPNDVKRFFDPVLDIVCPRFGMSKAGGIQNETSLRKICFADLKELRKAHPRHRNVHQNNIGQKITHFG